METERLNGAIYFRALGSNAPQRRCRSGSTCSNASHEFDRAFTQPTIESQVCVRHIAHFAAVSDSNCCGSDLHHGGPACKQGTASARSTRAPSRRAAHPVLVSSLGIAVRLEVRSGICCSDSKDCSARIRSRAERADAPAVAGWGGGGGRERRGAPQRVAGARRASLARACGGPPRRTLERTGIHTTAH